MRNTPGAFIVDRKGTILGFDQALELLTGWPAVEVVGHSKDLGATSTATPSSPALCTRPLYEGEIAVDDRSQNLELTLHCRDGKLLNVEVAAARLPGPGDRMLVRVLRVLARSTGPATISGATCCDGLTGLSGRDAFAARLAEAFRVATTTASPLAVVLVDVDHLRDANDRWGGEAGDEVLRSIAGILRVAVDDEHALARLADDDFAILRPHAGRGEARQLAAGIRSAVERFRFFPQADASTQPQITVSLGAASFPADADNAFDLMERAQDALEEARTMGRNRVWCYVRRPRVPLQVPVFFDGTDQLLLGYTRDLSPSGIFVQTAAPIDVGMRCALAFPLPGHDGRVHVIGRIVRTVLPETSEETTDLRIPGIGVEFTRFGGHGDRRAIESFLHRHEAATWRPEGRVFSV